MSPFLSPQEAAEAAVAVYGVRLSDDVDTAFRRTILRNNFSLGGREAKISGQSGILRSDSGFGVIAAGTGARSNEVVIVTRGTVTSADWYNNALANTTLSTTGKSVHSGFNKIFLSLQNELELKLKLMSPSSIHCVGHSLGGALANLVAEWVLANKLAEKENVYTFGSPRVGMRRFAEDLTNSAGVLNIHRVYHKTDIVPMVPVWPYVHSPEPGMSCFIDSPGNYPGGEYHDKELYLSSVKSYNKWEKLKRHPPKTNLEQQVEDWMDSDSPLSLTTNTIALISSAIIYAIKKISLAGLQFVVGEAVNVIDVLAQFFAKAVHVSKDILGMIGNLMKRILQALGVASVKVGNVTYDFVKWVLDTLSSALYKTVSAAVRFVHNGL